MEKKSFISLIILIIFNCWLIKTNEILSLNEGKRKERERKCVYVCVCDRQTWYRLNEFRPWFFIISLARSSLIEIQDFHLRIVLIKHSKFQTDIDRQPSSSKYALVELSNEAVAAIYE